MSGAQLGRLITLAMLATFAPRTASAHRGPISYCTVETVPGGVDVELEIPSAHLGLPTLEPSASAITAAAPRIVESVLEQVTARTPHGACEVEVDPLRVLERDLRSAALMLHFTCPEGPVTLRNAWALEREPWSQSVCAIDGEAAVFQRGALERDVGVPEPLGAALASYLKLGAEHVALGLDHVLFVVSLLLGAALRTRELGTLARLGRVTALITSFTLGHSLTLIAAGLGWLPAGGKLVESAIALSIVLSALLNLVSSRRGDRLVMAAGFGLVHGLGFAAALTVAELPRRATVLALLLFNLGIELAQIVLVGLLFPALALLSRRPDYVPRVLRPASAVILAAGLVWLVQRVAES